MGWTYPASPNIITFKRNSKEDEIFIPNRVELKATNQQTQPKGCCSV